MTPQPLNVDHVAFAGLLLQTLKITFDALADMYERKDGPWVDELREAVVDSSAAPTAAEAQRIIAVLNEFRRELAPGQQLERPE